MLFMNCRNKEVKRRLPCPLAIWAVGLDGKSCETLLNLDAGWFSFRLAAGVLSVLLSPLQELFKCMFVLDTVLIYVNILSPLHRSVV